MVPAVGLWSTWEERSRTPTMRLPDPRPRRPARAALLGLLLCALLPAGSARPVEPDKDAAAFLARLEGAWQTRDLGGWLALWDFASPEQRASEEDTVRAAFSSDETVLNFLRRPAPPRGRRGSAPTSRSSPRPSRGPRWPTGGSRWRDARQAGPSWAGRKPGRSTASSTSRSDRRPGARAGCRCASRTSSSEWRTAPSTPPPTRSGRRPSPSWAARACASLPPRPPSASSCASSPARRRWTARSPGPSSACTRPTSTAPSTRAISWRSRTRSRGAPRPSACGGSARSGPSRSTRRFPAPRGG